MNRASFSVILILLLALILASASCTSKEEAVSDPAGEFKAAYEKYRMMDDRAAKAEMMDEFVTSYPDSELTGRAIGLVVYNRYLANDDFAGALGYLDNRLEAITNPAVTRSVTLQKVEVLGELKKAEELTSLAEELLNSPEGLSGGEKQQVLASATEAGAWELADTFSDLLLADLKESDDKYALSSVMAKKARVLYNLDQNGKALELFAHAASLAPRNFAGYFEYPVMDFEYRWADALQASGDPGKALEVLEQRALFVKEETPVLQGMHQDKLKELYLETGREEAGFDEYKAERKNELSRQVPEFSAPDSTGLMRSFSELRGEKATLLVFWFPT